MGTRGTGRRQTQDMPAGQGVRPGREVSGGSWGSFGPWRPVCGEEAIRGAGKREREHRHGAAGHESDRIGKGAADGGMAGSGLRVAGLAAGHVAMRAVMAVTRHVVAGHVGGPGVMRMGGPLRGVGHGTERAEHQCDTGEHQAKALRQIGKAASEHAET